MGNHQVTGHNERNVTPGAELRVGLRVSVDDKQPRITEAGTRSSTVPS
jgi:hypothetical protein